MDFTEIANKLGLDWRMILFNSINFILFYMVLNKFLFGKIAKAIEQRQEKVTESLKYAQEIDEVKSKVNDESEAIIAQANAKANEIIESSRMSAAQLEQEAKQKTAQDIENMQAKAETDLENQKKSMFDSLKKQTAEVAITATEKIIRKELDTEKDKAIIEEYLQGLEVAKK